MHCKPVCQHTLDAFVNAICRLRLLPWLPTLLLNPLAYHHTPPYSLNHPFYFHSSAGCHDAPHPCLPDLRMHPHRLLLLLPFLPQYWFLCLTLLHACDDTLNSSSKLVEQLARVFATHPTWRSCHDVIRHHLHLRSLL